MTDFTRAAAIPPLDGTVRLSGLDAPVVIHRDRWGIPHIRAQNTADLFFGQGFACAQDRLFQIEYDRLRAYGRTAAALGPAGLPWDTFARRARLGGAARDGFAALDGATRQMLESYAAGVNAFLQTCSARPIELQALGHEPAAWEPHDAVAIFLVRHILFATLATKLFRARVVARLGAPALAWFRQEGPTGRDVSVILPPGTRAALSAIPLDSWQAEIAALHDLPEAMGGAGSNSWGLAGSRTASGRPLLGGDPHRLLEVPNVYVQTHLAAPEFDAVGLAFAGIPGLTHFGQNEHVAWCVTNAQADYQDLFIERFRSSGDDLLVETAAGWVAAQVETEAVTVRDAAPHRVEFVVTPHGPVIIGDPRRGTALALRSTGLLEPGGSLRAALPLLRARCVDDAERALATWVEPTNNYLLADTAGTLSYRTAGRIPVRPEPNFWIPVPGWDGLHEWEEIIPDAELPRCRNPEGGALVTANQRITDMSYPHLLGVDYVNGHRADRIAFRLQALQRARCEDFAAIHRDTVSNDMLALRDRVISLPPAEVAPEARALQARLAGWDGRMARESGLAAALAEVRAQLIRAICNHPRFAPLRLSPFADEPEPVWPLELRIALSLQTLLAQPAHDVFDSGTTWERLLGGALSAAAGDLANAGDQCWGERHRAMPLHALRGWSSDLDAALAVPMPQMAGDLGCVFSTGGPSGVFDLVLVASTARYVFDLGDRQCGGWVVPLGASGHPASPHFTDQQDAWAAGELLPMVSDWQRLASEAETTQRLEPHGRAV